MTLLTMEVAGSERRMKGGALVAVDAGYSDVEKLEEWVGKVDLSGNNLTGLGWLGGKVSCAKLARNKLKKLEGLGECEELRTLDVSENPLESLEGVQAAGNLNVLIAARCTAIGAESIPPLIALPQLHTLVLRDIPLGSVSLTPLCQIKTLTKLSLSNCELTKLPWAGRPHRLTNLKELRLSNNHLATLDAFTPGCASLRILDLGSNNFGEDCLQVVSTLPKLTHLTLRGNPIAKSEDYRKVTLDACRGKLKYLDDDHATDELHDKKKRKREIMDAKRKPPKRPIQEEQAPAPVVSKTVRKNTFLIAIKQDFTADYEEEPAQLFQIKNPTTGASHSERDSGVVRITHRDSLAGKKKDQRTAIKNRAHKEKETKTSQALDFLLNHPRV